MQTVTAFLFSKQVWNPAPYLRMVIVALVILPRIRRDLGVLAHYDGADSFLMDPGSILVRLGLHAPLTPELLRLFTAFFFLCALFALLGIVTRLSLLGVTLCFGYVSCLLSSWGAFHHVSALVFLVLCALVFAPGVDSWSIDSLLRARRQKKPVLTALKGEPVPRWGTVLILCLICSFYFNAGVAKIRHGGKAWLRGDTLTFYLSRSTDSTHQLFGSNEPEETWKDGFGLTHYIYSTPASAAGRTLASYRPLTILLALASLGIQLMFPLALFGPWLRNFFLCNAIVFHVVSDWLLDVTFTPYVLMAFVLIDWPAFGPVFSSLRSKRSATQI